MWICLRRPVKLWLKRFKIKEMCLLFCNVEGQLQKQLGWRGNKDQISLAFHMTELVK